VIDEILSYREMCDAENAQTLQRGMNYRINPRYSLILMSQRTNAPYRDRILVDGITIEYEGHDEPKTSHDINPKELDQPKYTKTGLFTQNGLFTKAIEKYRNGLAPPELVKAYEKILAGVWSLKGLFNLIDFRVQHDGKRNVFIFILRLSESQNIEKSSLVNIEHTRLIPSEVKKEVWKRDKGKCVICGSNNTLHFDHDLPFSRGGTSLTEKNIRLLCAKCNLAKSNRIE